ncbi:HK97-gp10 family putative phage morphogenesis protein [Paraburkholderia tropica]|uniref:HK97-gp10 family putative phage morphogenesis protein n=1 Tax=Paraburkholderia tropica TaxID=92647 RepID=UPI00161F2AF4|nr:HK97-gp10 family putative phage morphogenesis protein [Paraburkholderia tropica]MBB2977679.1 HK97 gp10 family phage protein [Paraburkholderia tropica]
MPARVTIKNPAGLTDVLTRLGEVASESVLRQAVVTGLQPLLAEVRLRAPVRATGFEGGENQHPPGFLKANILAFHDGERSVGGLRQIYGVTWDKEAFYGKIIEYGSSKMSAQPFLRPAYAATRRQIVQAIDQFIQAKARELANGG